MVHWAWVFAALIIGGTLGFGTCALFAINSDEDQDDREWLERNGK